MKTILVVLLMSLSISASAGDKPWKTYQDGNNYYIVDGPTKGGGTNWIAVRSEKAGKKLAKKLNKIKKKDEGVWNDGTDHCNDPINEC